MYQGATPGITFTIANVDVTAMRPFVTFKNGNYIFTKKNNEVVMTYDTDSQKSIIVIPMTQEETLRMTKGSVIIQCKFIDINGMVYVTNKAVIPVDDALLKEIIVYEDEEEEDEGDDSDVTPATSDDDEEEDEDNG